MSRSRHSEAQIITMLGQAKSGAGFVDACCDGSGKTYPYQFVSLLLVRNLPALHILLKASLSTPLNETGPSH